MIRPRIEEAHEFSTHPLGAAGRLEECFASDVGPHYSMKHTPEERVRFALSQLRQALIDKALDGVGDDGRSFISPDEDSNRWKAQSNLIDRMDKYLLREFNLDGVMRQAMPTLKGYLDAALE